MFWDSRLCPQVVSLFAFPAGSVKGAASLDLDRIAGLRRVLVTPDGCRHLLVKHQGRSVQICLSGASLTKSVHLLADALIGPDRLAAGLRAIADFNHLLQGRIELSRPSASQHGRRLRQILRALDGRRAGATYRDIAVVLFGAQRVERDWNDDGDHLKNHVRRLVKRGEGLVDGGYKRLLRQQF